MIRRTALITGLCLLTSCGGSNAPTAPSSPAPAAATGVVQGILRHDAVYLSYGRGISEGPLAGAQVVVIEGPGAGQSVTTGADGAYRLELPPGPFRVRWSASGYETRDSDSGNVTAGSTTTVTTVVLRSLSNVPIAEWSISGTVRDGAGNPLVGAWVTAGDVLDTYADATTDAAGHYRIASTRQHPDPLHLNASAPFYLSQYFNVTCGPSCAITSDFRLLRKVRDTLDGPSTMRVGDVAPLTIVAEYDDGSRTPDSVVVESSDPAVVQVLPLQPPYDHTYIKAIAPGTATLRLPYAPGPTTFNVRVVP